MRHVLSGMVCGVALTAIGWQLNDQAHGQPAGDIWKRTVGQRAGRSFSCPRYGAEPGNRGYARTV